MNFLKSACSHLRDTDRRVIQTVARFVVVVASPLSLLAIHFSGNYLMVTTTLEAIRRNILSNSLKENAMKVYSDRKPGVGNTDNFSVTHAANPPSKKCRVFRWILSVHPRAGGVWIACSVGSARPPYNMAQA